MYIGINNFRVFKELTKFNIKPITILVGANNSGKSSFTKLLLLLKNGFKNLDFETGNHNLEGYEKSLNWDLKDDKLNLQFSTGISFLDDNFFCEIIYSSSDKVEEIRLSNGTVDLFLFKNGSMTAQEIVSLFYDDVPKTTMQKVPYNYFSVDIKYLIDLIYNKELIVWEFGKKVALQNIKNREENINFSDYRNISFQKREEEKFYPTGYIYNMFNSALYNEIEVLNKDYLLYEVFINGEKQTQDNEFLLKLQNEAFSNIEIVSFDAYNRVYISDFLSDFLSANKTVKRKIKEEFKKLHEENFGSKNAFEITIKESKLGNFLFNEKIFYELDFMGDLDFNKTLFDQFENLFTKIESLKTLQYISAHRGNQKRVLQKKSDADIDEIMLDYFKRNETLKKDEFGFDWERVKENKPFLKEVFKILGIEGELVVNHIENSITTVHIQTKDRKIALADFGFGYSQIIPIVIKIFNSGANNNLLIIEEPEANLHPKLQSKLADIFVIATKYFPHLKLVIETHSEYLIRKLQYLVAKKELPKEKAVIYYFNSDEFVTKQEPKVKLLEITENGNLTDNFGTGFYDEATKLQFELMRLNKEQRN